MHRATLAADEDILVRFWFWRLLLTQLSIMGGVLEKVREHRAQIS
jgi:hypothetical protein